MLIGEKVRVLLQTLSIYFEGSQEYILWKIIKNFQITDPTNFRKEFILKKISSKELEKQLVLMESKNITLRKLSMFILTLLTTNKESKIYFLEKCGLPLNPGRIMLTRFKYLSRCCSDTDSIEILKALSQSPTKDTIDRLFWYVQHDEESITNKKFGMREVKISILNDQKDNESLKKLPDPIQNVVGIFLLQEDISKSSARNEVRSVSVSSKREAIAKRVNRNTNRENIKSFTGENDSFIEKYNTLNLKSAKRTSTAYQPKKDNFISKNSDLPVKEVSKKYNQMNYEKTKKSEEILNKSKLENSFASPLRILNSGKSKQNRQNANYQPLSATRRDASNVSRLISQPKKSARGDTISKQNSSYINMTMNNKPNVHGKEDSFCSVSNRRPKPYLNQSINAGKKTAYGTVQETDLSNSQQNIALNVSSCTDRRRRTNPYSTKPTKIVNSKIARDVL